MVRWYSLLVAVWVLGAAGPAMALDASTDDAVQQQRQREQSLNQRRSIEGSGTVTRSVQAGVIFRAVLAEMEQQRDPVLHGCRLITRPQRPADFGLTAVVEQGDGQVVIDTVLAQGLEQEARANLVAPAALRRYADCMVLYGALVGQGLMNLDTLIPAGEAVSLNDLSDAAHVAIEMVKQRGVAGDVKRSFTLMKQDRSPCRFNGTLERITCGMVDLSLSEQTLVLASGIEWYGKSFAGIHAEFGIGETRRTTREMLIAQKKEWDRNQSSRVTASAAELLKIP